MDIISGLGAATEGLKILNELRKIDKELDKAELKLRLVDISDKLLDSKQALQEALERERSLEKEIEALTARLRHRASLKDEAGRLYEVDNDGKRFGEPYCNLCYVRDDKLYRLLPRDIDRSEYFCGNCKSVYAIQRVFKMRPSLSDLGKDLA